jgi:hypothetical protein
LKLPGMHQAKHLYIGSLFKKSVRLATLMGVDSWVVLSAKYGIVQSDEMIKSYEHRLSKKRKDIDALQKIVLERITDLFPSGTEFIAYVCNEYEEILKPINSITFPLHGLRLGPRLRLLNQMIGDAKCIS